MDEKPEGLGDDVDRTWGDYPIDTMLIRTESRTVHDVLRRIDKGSFVMDPDFQRDFIWGEDKQSKLIESVFMRIPLPVFYLAEDKKGRMIVVDGLQRLSTFQRFVGGNLRLKLDKQLELKGKRFGDLPPKLQNRVEDCNLILYVIDAKVPERARLDIFERVNGGVPLTRQQMRNCLHMGIATRFLKEEATTNIFQEATGKSLHSKTMRDREFVNRFCAFEILPLLEYKGDMDEFLAESLTAMNFKEEPYFQGLSTRFRRSLANNFGVFGKLAFRKHTSDQDSRSVINASLWDIMITGLARYPEHVVEAKASFLREAFYRMLKDEEFNHHITVATSDFKKVMFRFEKSKAMFKEVFGDYPA